MKCQTCRTVDMQMLYRRRGQGCFGPFIVNEVHWCPNCGALSDKDENGTKHYRPKHDKTVAVASKCVGSKPEG